MVVFQTAKLRRGVQMSRPTRSNADANDDKFAGNCAGDFRGERLDARSDLRCGEENAHPAQGYLARRDDVVRPIFRRLAVTIEVICIGLRHIGRFPALRARRSSVGCDLESGRATPS